MPAYWLMKSEPDVFSVDDLQASPGRKSRWEGVRNYQARNYMRQMRRGDAVLFYHSSCPQPGVVGLAEIAGEAQPDPSQFDPASPYFDPKSPPADPRWSDVVVRLKRRFRRTIGLAELRAVPELADLVILRRGNRLSVTPVDPAHFACIVAIAGSGRASMPG